MIFSRYSSQPTNTFFGEFKLVNSLTIADRCPACSAANQNPHCRQRSLPGRRAPATSRVDTVTPPGKEQAMKTAMTTRNSLRNGTRRGALALLLGGAALVAFLWSLRSGQYDDLDGAAERILLDDEGDPHS